MSSSAEQGTGMNATFPSAVPEIPVANVAKAAEYYERCFGFNKDWGEQDGGIGEKCLT
jgi:hypothetical protein